MSRFLITRIVFFAYLLILLFKLDDGTLLFQQSYPVFINPNLNITYWIFVSTGLNEIVFQSPFLKYAIDATLFCSCILCIIKPKVTIFPIVFTCFLWLYQFLYYSIVASQPFAIGLLFPCIPFIFKDNLKFFLTYSFGRFFLCGLYFLAGVLKIINGGVFNIYQMSSSLKNSISDYIYYNSDSFKAEIMSFLIVDYKTSFLLFLFAAILESAFIVGFITKRYDFYLMLLFLLFHIADYLLLDLPFTNHIIILVFFIPLKNTLYESSICKNKTLSSY